MSAFPAQLNDPLRVASLALLSIARCAQSLNRMPDEARAALRAMFGTEDYDAIQRHVDGLRPVEEQLSTERAVWANKLDALHNEHVARLAEMERQFAERQSNRQKRFEEHVRRVEHRSVVAARCVEAMADFLSLDVGNDPMTMEAR